MNQASAAMDTNKSPQRPSLFASAWLQLIIGIICMVMIANLQYGWTFFVPDIQKTFGWDRASIQIAFTLFVLFETWLVPIEGWFVDRFGPQIVVFLGGIACAFGWAMNSYATTLGQFYFAQIIAGIGISRVSLDILNIFDRNEGCPFDIAPSMSINQVGQISTASCLPQAARYFRIGKTPLSFMLEKLIKCETDVFSWVQMLTPGNQRNGKIYNMQRIARRMMYVYPQKL